MVNHNIAQGHPLVLPQRVWFAQDPKTLQYSPVRIVKMLDDFSLVLQVNKYVELTVSWADLEKDVELICPLNDPEDKPGKFTAKDLTQLGDPNIDEIESCLRNQFVGGLIYTQIGDHIQLHIYPNRPMQIYDEQFINRYKKFDLGLPPHIFRLAMVAYQAHVSNLKSQVILSIGESGSGKSASVSHIIIS